ncbi:glutamyl-tRNA(Gln) amidotransferase subunit B, mitochondrial [Cloeon dipterum]|uniref:glutamyl-tRNA(Gln) amidotransferase subunit B, mitochondrial n=1 Tax=Cloeon dipterum TaxID=197152 RepID=UPI00321F9CDB
MQRSVKSRAVRQAINFCRSQHSKVAKESETPAEWKGVVGLEIHAQISTNSKLFSRSSTEFSSPVNENVALFDAATPGTLPVINKACVESALLTALALQCKINPASTFDRKHYFYADMPAGYQITQQRNALANNGVLRFYVTPPDGKPYLKSSKLKQLQLEQDSGKSLHDIEGRKILVDLNRAGIALMELVFEPDLSNGEEAASLVKELALIFRKLKTCSCKMEEGALRVDANVSVQKTNSTTLGPRTEIKNINSIRGVANAINFEIQRQIDANKRNERVVVETRAYDAQNKSTVAMRDKEEKQDYRFMPEPNLPPLRLAEGETGDKKIVSIDTILKRIPELPEKVREKLMKEFDLVPIQAINLVNDEFLLELFYELCNQIEKPNGRTVYGVIMIDLLALLKQNGISYDKNPISTGNLLELYHLKQERLISSHVVSKVMDALNQDPSNSAQKIVEENSWFLINDREVILKVCTEVVAENQKKVRAVLKGKKNSFGSLISAVDKKFNNQVDMQIARSIMEELIEKERNK